MFILITVFEEEIVKGLLEDEQTRDHSLVYIRELVDIPRRAKSNLTEKYTDTQKVDGKWTLSEEAKLHLDELKTNIVDAFSERNIRYYKMKVKECFSQSKNVTADSKEEKSDSNETKDTLRYMDQFIQDFVNDIKGQIEKDKEQWDANMGVKHSLIFSEVLHHATRCHAAAKDFVGRDDLLNSVKLRLVDKNQKKPLVISGEAGSGIPSYFNFLFLTPNSTWDSDGNCINLYLLNLLKSPLFKFSGKTYFVSAIANKCKEWLGKIMRCDNEIPLWYDNRQPGSSYTSCTACYASMCCVQSRPPRWSHNR